MLFPLFPFLHTHVLIPYLAKRPSRYEEIQRLNLTAELSDHLDRIRFYRQFQCEIKVESTYYTYYQYLSALVQRVG